MALRKVETLLDYDCHVTVIAPETGQRIEYYADKKMLDLEKREYASPEASEYDYVISASDDDKLNHIVHDDCHRAGVLVNVVDNPPLCDFIFPAVVRRDCLTVSVSSDGKAPFLSGSLRLILENIFPEHWSKIAGLAARFRRMVQEKWSHETEKKEACFGKFMAADWKQIIKEKNSSELEQHLIKMLEV